MLIDQAPFIILLGYRLNSKLYISTINCCAPDDKSYAAMHSIILGSCLELITFL